jgi:hypothetical protein
MKSFLRSAVLTVLLFAPALAFASTIVGGVSNNGFFFGYSSGSGFGSCGSGGICGVASTILYLINAVAVPLLFAVAFIVFLYGVAKTYIFSQGNEDAVKEGHRLILWGVIGFAVMISLWGLVNVVVNTFGLGAGGSAGSYGITPPSL